MARKGMKIQVMQISIEKKWHDYTIKLSKESGSFFIETESKLLNAILESKDAMGMSSPSYREIISKVKSFVKEHHKSLEKKESIVTKVIMFILEMNYMQKEYDEDGDWSVKKSRIDDGFSRGSGISKIKFNYWVVEKVELDGEFVRYQRVGTEYPVSFNHDEEEMIWTQEAEDFFYNLKEGMNKLFSRIDDFFGEKNDKVLENLQSFNGNLLTFDGGKDE